MKMPAWLLKKGVKIPLIILLSILLFLVLLNFIVPPIAHSYLEKHSKELCNRVVTMDKLKMNIFLGKVKIEGLKALEENEKDEMLSFGALEVRISLFRLLTKEVRLNKIALETPHVAVWQRDSIFNFSDIIEFYSNDEDDDDTTSSGWVVDLRDISITKGTVVYRDLVRSSLFDLRDFSVAVPRLYFGGDRSNIGVAFKLANGGELAFQMLYGLNDNSYKLNVSIDKMAINAFQPYIKSFMNVGDIDGELSTQMSIAGNLNHILEIVANGNVSLDNVRITDCDNMEFLSLNSFTANVDEVDLKNNKYHFGNIAFNGVEINCEMFEGGNTFSKLMGGDTNSVETADTTLYSDTESKDIHEVSGQPVDFKINSLVIDKSTFVLHDTAIGQQFQFPITSINANFSNITLNDIVKAKIKAVVGSCGELTANWEGTLKGFENHKLFLKLQNFKMTDISPYCMHYTAYPVSAGVLSFTSRNSIKESNLDSKNNIDIYKCKVEKKDKSIKPEYKIPLKAAVYVLTDRKGKISMSLPVKGNVSDPDFSLRRIIWKTIGNFLLKVVAAPADFLANALGGKENAFDDIQMDLTDRNISSENYDKLNSMSDIIKEKPEMKLSVKQYIDRAENEQLFASLLNTTDSTAISNAIDKSVEARNQMLQNYFEVQGIAVENIEILPVGEKSPGKGKATFSFELIVPSDEPIEDLEFIE